MKIIISHDVDHLYPSEHIFRDLYFPKLYIRSFLELIKVKINIRIFLNRIVSLFEKKMNRIPEIIEFERQMNIPSTFFFGMANALGLSYKTKNAQKWIEYVRKNNFDVGVHGIDYNNPENEFKTFKMITGLEDFGIRMHYVRYDDETFEKLATIGYLYDCSEFNKKETELKDVYKIGEMWEFPLHIMDKYVLRNGLLKAKDETLDALRVAKENKIKYFTLLFHDDLFDEKTYPMYKEYYEWFINYCISNRNGDDFQFVSYKDAVHELNSLIK